MSDSNDVTQTRSITLSDSQVLLDIGSESGSHSKRLENGISVVITIENGKIVNHVAHDSEGNPLKPFYLQMHSAPGEEGRICWACYSSDGTYGTEPFCCKISCNRL